MMAIVRYVDMYVYTAVVLVNELGGKKGGRALVRGRVYKLYSFVCKKDAPKQEKRNNLKVSSIQVNT